MVVCISSGSLHYRLSGDLNTSAGVPCPTTDEGEVLRSYSNNPAVNTISVSQGEFYGSPSTMRKAEKNEKSFNLAPWGNIDLEAIEGIRQGDHYRVLGCWVNTGRKMAPCYFKTKLIAVNDAGRH